jgi:hypothetical protein
MMFQRPSWKSAFDEQYVSGVTSLTMNIFFSGIFGGFMRGYAE